MTARQTLPRTLVVASYAVLGAALVWSRLFELGHSFWFDEIAFVEGFVRKGPDEILGGSGVSHQLYGVLSWLISTLVGESEIALRLGSAVPFVVAVVLVAAWLHIRVHALAGILSIFLATTSPLLLDITRQARGYGLAFFAMSLMVVAALEAERSGRALPVVVMCVAGVIGTWTLPQFGFAFLGTGVALLVDRRVRLPAVISLALSLVAVAVWYSPKVEEVEASSQIPDGIRIGATWLVTAPIDRVLIPALIWLDGTLAVPGLFWLPFIALAVVVIASSPLARERQSALILCSGLVVTVVALWLAEAYVLTRYVSFLLVPIFILLSSGAASILTRIPTRPQLLRSVACIVVIAVLAVRYVTIAPDVVGLPREANRDAAEIIESRSAANTPVLAYAILPQSLRFYLDRPVMGIGKDEWSTVAARVCGVDGPVVYFTQPFRLKPVNVPCLDRRGVEHYRFRQYARGEETNVWFVPPAT